MNVLSRSPIIGPTTPSEFCPTNLHPYLIKLTHSLIKLPSIGSYVRLNRLRKLFDKESTGTWTTEIFRVVSHKNSRPIPMIHVADLTGEPVLGALYPQEFQTVVFNDSRTVDKVLKTRKHRKSTQYLVSFVGYPASFTQWVYDKS